MMIGFKRSLFFLLAFCFAIATKSQQAQAVEIEEINTSDDFVDFDLPDFFTVSENTSEDLNDVHYTVDFSDDIKKNFVSDEIKKSNNSSSDILLNSVYQSYVGYGGLFSDNYLNWARGFLSRVPFGKHYVFFRSGSDHYIFAYGDLSFSGTTFSGSQIKLIHLNSYYQNNQWFYQSYLSSDNSFSLDTNNTVVYSDIVSSPFSSLSSDRDINYSILFALGLSLLLTITSPLFSIGKVGRKFTRR